MIEERSYTPEALATAMCGLFDLRPAVSSAGSTDVTDSHAVVVIDTEIVDIEKSDVCDVRAACQVYRDCFGLAYDKMIRDRITKLEVKTGDSPDGSFAFARLTLAVGLSDLERVVDHLALWRKHGNDTNEFSIEAIELRCRNSKFKTSFIERI